MFDASPMAGDAGVLELHDGGRVLCVRGRCSSSPPAFVATDAGVLELGPGASAGELGPASSGDAGGELGPVDAGAVAPLSDAGEPEPAPSDESVDAGAVAPLSDAGEPEPMGDAGGELGPVLCTDTCIDGTFRCPSSSSASGFVCRSWPPCYCTPDGGGACDAHAASNPPSRRAKRHGKHLTIAGDELGITVCLRCVAFALATSPDASERRHTRCHHMLGDGSTRP